MARYYRSSASSAQSQGIGIGDLEDKNNGLLGMTKPVYRLKHKKKDQEIHGKQVFVGDGLGKVEEEKDLMGFLLFVAVIGLRASRARAISN